MRRTRTLAILSALLSVSGCHRHYAAPESPMPPNTILLSQMLREQPGFTETLLAQLNAPGKKGPALLTPKLIDELRTRILGADWSGLDRFPGWTMREINPTVRVVGHFAGKDQKLEADSAVHPGAPASTADLHDLLDLGPYALDQAGTISLNQPSTLPAFTTKDLVTDLGNNITRGDGPNILAPEHAESQRLANILNRLSVNKFDDAEQFTVHAWAGVAAFESIGVDITTPEDLIRNLQRTGHSVTVNDTRYFANFAHLHYKGKDVMAPFWINTGLQIPNTHRPLLIPVAHAEYEWHIRGPQLNADIGWYFGIDGKAEFRTMDTLDQPWVLKRNAHTYTGRDAVEVTRLTGLFTLAYMRQHRARPALPFGGYYALGVCQDSISAIELHLTGRTTLFPNTADAALFNNPRDSEINTLIAAIPKDRDGAPPTPERIFGSLPTAPAADMNHAFDSITIPGLAADLNASYTAWQQGKLHRTHPLRYMAAAVVAAMLFLGAVVWLYRARRRQLSTDNTSH